MWSNLNDSFTAITGHISNLRQSIPSTIQFGESPNISPEQRERETATKIDLLRNEVVRHRNIAMMYKERWLKAEKVCQDSTGNFSQIYEDDLNLLDDDDDDEEVDENISADPKTLEENIEDLNEPTSKLTIVAEQIEKKTPIKQPKCIKDLALNSATLQIHSLQDEIRKLQTDGEHWRKLAKQKSADKEQYQLDLDQVRSQLKDSINECRQHESRCLELEQNIQRLQTDSEQELQQLDLLHEQEKSKLLTLRDDLLEENGMLKKQIENLQQYQIKNDPIEKNDSASQTEHDDGDERTKQSLSIVSNDQISIESIVTNKTVLDIWCQTDVDDQTIKDLEKTSIVETLIQNSIKRLPIDVKLSLSSQTTVETILPILCEHIDQLHLKIAKFGEGERSTSLMTLPDSSCVSDSLIHDCHDDDNDATTTTTVATNALLSANDEQELFNPDEHLHLLRQQNRQLLNELNKYKTLHIQNSEQAVDDELTKSEAGILPNNAIIKSNDDLSSSETTKQQQEDLPPEQYQREEPEGAQENDHEHQSNQSSPDNRAQQHELTNLRSVVDDLHMKLETLTRENEDLWQKLNSAQNENQIFERRFKETEEESVKIAHKLHQTEQELESAKAHLTQREQEQNEKLEKELKQWHGQVDQLQSQLQQFYQDNVVLKQTLAQKDEELIRLRESIEKNETDARQKPQPEQMEKLTLELNRLREHLIQVEEQYLGYLKEAEERYEQAQLIIQRYEQMNLEQRQIEHEEVVRTLKRELDQTIEQLHEFEDRNERLAANLVNLQSVIEQLEKEHERKLKTITEEHKRQLAASDNRVEDVRQRLMLSEEHLLETRQALEAASRLSEKIDQKEFIIEQLKREAKNKDQESDKLRQKILELEASHEGKVDKQIIKNLIISYLATPMDKRSDGERLLARFLDFNQDEMNRVGIRVGRDGRPNPNDSFTSRFVQFLETESSSPSVSGGEGRKLSTTSTTGSQQSIVNVQQMELARDLNKRLNQFESPTASITSTTRMNPFVGHSQNQMVYGHSRTPSMHSQSSDNMTTSTNQLLANACQPIDQLNHQILAPQQQQPIGPSARVNIPEIVRDAICKDKFI